VIPVVTSGVVGDLCDAMMVMESSAISTASVLVPASC
jgi:hypothetical protein